MPISGTPGYFQQVVLLTADGTAIFILIMTEKLNIEFLLIKKLSKNYESTFN